MLICCFDENILNLLICIEFSRWPKQKYKKGADSYKFSASGTETDQQVRIQSLVFEISWTREPIKMQFKVLFLFTLLALCANQLAKADSEECEVIKVYDCECTLGLDCPSGPKTMNVVGDSWKVGSSFTVDADECKVTKVYDNNCTLDLDCPTSGLRTERKVPGDNWCVGAPFSRDI